jgi:hypothetical protein
MPIRLTLVICLVLAASFARAQQQDSTALVRQSVDIEIKAAQDYSSPYKYILRKESNSGIAVRQMVETNEGILLARTITWNGRVPSDDEQAKEDRRLERLAESKEEREKKLREQQEDAQRALRFLRAFPVSSIYTLVGHETMNGRDAIHFSFRPNPKFSPDAKETYLLKAAVGNMWIDSATKRMMRIEATTTDSVNIGWGLLGHIDKGGKLLLVQTLVKGGQWRLTRLDIDATGKALVFKSIKVKQHQSGSDYQPIRPVSVAEGVQMLKQAAVTRVAER